MSDVPVRKLIETSIPLEAINAESAREKSIRHGHPSTLHLWWARRPLAAARAVLFAQLVDDPAGRPDLYPTTADQEKRRDYLHDLIRRLVKWENISDESLYREAREAIAEACGGNPPAILDPFAGGGTIPLEAQRLGLEAHASDLNPVAVLINKALIEIPPKFAGRPPVFPGAAETKMGDWPRAAGLAEDVRRYGAWMRDRAAERIGHLYPQADVPIPGPDGEPTGATRKATVIAWIWARTVTCPNPACGIEMPLVRSWWLGKKKGKEAYVVPQIVPDDDALAGKRVRFTIGHDAEAGPTGDGDGTIVRGNGVCVACDSIASAKYVRSEARRSGLGTRLMSIVAEGKTRRVYIEPDAEQIAIADVVEPSGIPIQAMPRHSVSPASQQTITIYGFDRWVDLFTNRQLSALATFSDLVSEAWEKVFEDAISIGMSTGTGFDDVGAEARVYADSVATFLGFSLSKFVARNNTLCGWEPGMDRLRGSFQRQQIPMTWDFAEAHPLATFGGGFTTVIESEAEALDALPAGKCIGVVQQADASVRDYSDVIISTDPPYYGNVGYSDLSDFFYVWLRRSLQQIHPDLFGPMLVPKAEELVANPYRHGGKDKAEKFFEEGFEHVFGRARASANPDYPITVFYAFKQKELEKEGVVSTGWATFLEGMIRQGWTITATCPVRSELSNRMIASGTNALASSIVLALRPRPADAPPASRRAFLAALQEELPHALAEVRAGGIAPVDLDQAVIGPGMAIYSRYSAVLETNGDRMPVKTALMLINDVLDQVQAEAEGHLDPDSRFAVAWFAQYGWNDGDYGVADNLARARNVSVDGIRESGILRAGDGIVSLVRPADLADDWNPVTDERVSVWEAVCHLARVLTDEHGGIEKAAQLLAAVGQRLDTEDVQALAFRLYGLAEAKKLSEARAFNALGSSWSDLTATAERVDATPLLVPTQGTFDDFPGEDH